MMNDEKGRNGHREKEKTYKRKGKRKADLGGWGALLKNKNVKPKGLTHKTRPSPCSWV